MVVVCGIDGSGKTTQEDTIVEAIREAGLACYCTKQPTSWYRSHDVVRRFLETGERSCSVDTIALLAAADRMLHIERDIQPRLKRGEWVVCNRYVYSTYAYFRARGVEMSFLQTINSRVPAPDFGVLLTVEATEAVRRIEARDRGNIKFEERDPSYLDSVQNELLRVWPDSFLRVDGALPRHEVSRRVNAYIATAIEVSR